MSSTMWKSTRTCLAVELDPSLKTRQVEAMSNGDTFIPAPPLFEIYPTQITYGRDKEKIETFVLGIKCAIKHARLLKEFFTQFSQPMEPDSRFGVFLPSGAMHMVGVEAYKKLLYDNNKFLQNITTVPIGDFPPELLDIPFSNDRSTDIDARTLYDTMLNQPWCLSVEKTNTTNKILLVTTKGQVLDARAWTDNSLLDIYQQHLAEKLDVTTLRQIIPRRLDKPVITTAATHYADKLKVRSSYVSVTTAQSSQFNRPPKHRNNRPADLTYAEATARATQATQLKSPPPAATAPPAAAATIQASSTPPFDYHEELKRITFDIENKLKAKLEAAIANLQSSVDALEKKFELKLQQSIENLQTTQADKTTQDTHSRELEGLTKNVRYLVDQVAQIADSLNIPTPGRGVGRS